MPSPKISDAAGRVAVSSVEDALARDVRPERTDLALAVRWLLQKLDESAPGNSVEVRVPPFGAVQCVNGPRHTRGTPANVVEMDAPTFVALASGALEWADAVSTGAIRASGIRSDLSNLFPLTLA